MEPSIIDFSIIRDAGIFVSTVVTAAYADTATQRVREAFKPSVVKDVEAAQRGRESVGRVIERGL